jgi:anaerobic selenocysteine-containing dehydrogenase
MPPFDVAEATASWMQLRPAVLPPLHQAKPDTEIIFLLAVRLGLGEHFFGGDMEAALEHQLAPAGLKPDELRAHPGGLRVDVHTTYEKYREMDGAGGKPRGFATPSGRVEIFSTTFAAAGYAPLPEFGPAGGNAAYPLILTFFRDVHFCDQQHRNLPRLRRALPEPFLEIHPQTAAAESITPGEWVRVETVHGAVRLKARINPSLHPQVVATVYGWWQACAELQLPAYDPFEAGGCNVNLLISNSDADPISASVAHRGQPCRVKKTA